MNQKSYKLTAKPTMIAAKGIDATSLRSRSPVTKDVFMGFRYSQSSSGWIILMKGVQSSNSAKKSYFYILIFLLIPKNSSKRHTLIAASVEQ